MPEIVLEMFASRENFAICVAKICGHDILLEIFNLLIFKKVLQGKFCNLLCHNKPNVINFNHWSKICGYEILLEMLVCLRKEN